MDSDHDESIKPANEEEIRRLRKLIGESEEQKTRLCHEHLSTKFRLQTDRRLTTQGTCTNPAGKYCPRRLAQWDGFLDEQRAALGKVLAFLLNTLQLFESRTIVRGFGRRLAMKHPIGSERDLWHFHHTAVEDPVQTIIEQFMSHQERADTPPLFGAEDSISFEHHMSILDSDITPSTSTANKISNQICVYRSLNGDRTLAYLLEYKAPHKLTAQHVREGFQDLDVIHEIVNCAEIPNDDDDRFRYYARRLSAAAATQTYHYMLQAGLEMGLVATGEVMIFLKIEWADPSTLYYHVAEPIPECQAQPAKLIPYCTAVSQLLAFTVMALLRPGPQGQDARERAISGAATWNENWEEILARMKDIPAARTPPSSGLCWEPRTYHRYDRSLIPFRHPRRNKGLQAHEPPPSLSRGQGPPPPDDDDAGQRGSKRKRSAAQSSGTAAAAAGPSPGGTQTQNRTHSSQPTTPSFCTHERLLGLVRGRPLDPSCPNITHHRRPCESSPYKSPLSSSLRRQGGHLLSIHDFLEQLRRQLGKTLDKGICCLGKYGARGALFSITLLSHGYTLVAKGTTSSLVPFIEHEARIYEQLQPIQGVYVPVSLGTIDLRELGRRYFHEGNCQIIYLLLLSWAGRDPRDAREASGVNVRKYVIQSLKELHALGVAHCDIRRENLVWSHGPSGRVMVIDFERSVVTKPSCRPGALGGRNTLFAQDIWKASGI